MLAIQLFMNPNLGVDPTGKFGVKRVLKFLNKMCQRTSLTKEILCQTNPDFLTV